MNLPTLPPLSPVAIILLKWTLLLALAWIAHFTFRQRHARWRIILWRTVLGFGAFIPLLHLAPFSIYTVTYEPRVEALSPATVHNSELPQPSSRGIDVNTTLEGSVAGSESHVMDRHETTPPSSNSFPGLFTIWLFGVMCCLARMVYWATQLAFLRKRSFPANEHIENLTSAIQQQLGIRRSISIRISDSANSPFLCGLLRPTIILPRTLLDSIPEHELSALLRHELAHVRHHDLFWSIAWRLAATAAWFHPLAWKIPSAHNLACEEEADRLASHSENSESYSRTLAQLALRVVALPSVETKLTLNAAAQIVQRLRALQRELPAWTRRHSIASVSIVLLLMGIAGGGKFLPAQSQAAEEFPQNETKELAVMVHDEDGKPLSNATVEPYGLRVKGLASSDHYGFPQRKKHSTDSNGVARVNYPIVAFPNEKQLTGKISLILSHSDFTTRTAELSMDETPAPIRLTRGATVEVSGFFGLNRERITNIVPNMSGDPRAGWTEKSPGLFVSRQIPAGGYMIQLSGKSPAGELIHSEAVPFNAVKGLHHRFDLELKPGIRLAGRLDDSVPRPVRYGRVVISVRPKEVGAYVIPEEGGELQKRYGYFSFWRSHRPIAEDGTFNFDSIPPGEVDVLVHGEGFASKNGGQPMNRIDGKPTLGLVIGVPQSFALTAPETRITVATEKTATVEVIARTKSGEPVEGASIYVNPNVMRMQTGIFGHIDPSNEEPFREIEPLPPIRYSSTTDEDGRAILENLPIVTRDLMLEHTDYAVPIHPTYMDRYLRFRLSPGEKKKIELTLEAKGSSHLGTAR